MTRVKLLTENWKVYQKNQTKKFTLQKQTQMEILELKVTVVKIKTSLDSLYTAAERISKLKGNLKENT